MIKAQNKIDKIMGEAYRVAFLVLAEEVRKFMKADPRFIKYHHMVGWGPSFDLADGSNIMWSHEMPTKRGREMLEFCDEFYDTYGAGNEKISLKEISFND